MKSLCAAVLALWPLTAAAQPLEMPGSARLEIQSKPAIGSYALPTGPITGGVLPVQRLEGVVTRQAWRIASGGLTTQQILAPLRDQLVAQGYATLFSCDTEACGGFDFRFATEVIAPPEMHVNLGDFRFLSARRGGPEGAEAVGLLVSRTELTGHLQIIRVGTAGRPEIQLPTPPGPGAAAATDDLAALLDAQGHAVLQGLDFETGAMRLGPGPHPALAALAGWLRADPMRRLALVGHTDTSGTLDANIALSRRRAAAVRDRLIDAHGVAGDRIDARGMGWLAPIATNVTREGREANRRVEAVVVAP